MRKNQKSYFRVSDVIKYTKKYYKKDCKEAIMKANLIKENIFLFNSPWDMEPTNIPYKLEPLQWDYAPNGDEEWIFMLNRHEYLYCLIIAYYLTRDESYIRKWIEIILHWIKNNPVKESSKAWRTIEAGIRAMSWTISLKHIISTGLLKDDELSTILNSLYEHTNFIEKHFKEKDLISNWGILQTTGVLAVLMTFGETDSNKNQLNWAIDKLEKQLNFQVFEDGIHWEQSPMYHVVVVLALLKLIYISKNEGVDLPNSIIEKSYNSSKALIYMKKPNHRQVMQSDSDDTDLRDICTFASIIFNDGELKWAGYDFIDFDTIWLLGYSGLENYKRIKKVKPKNTSKAFEDAGNFYLRSNLSEKASFCYFHNGTLGSGHGHADLGHFNISYLGNDFLIDPGRYTYVEKDLVREYLKSTRAHNTVLIDNHPFTLCKGSWSYDKAAYSLKNYWRFTDKIDYIEGTYLADSVDNEKYIVTRRLFFIKPSIWIISDIVYLQGKHICKKYFHLDKDVTVNIDNNIVDCMKNGVKLSLHHIDAEKIKIKKDYMSTKYNKLESSKTIVTNMKFMDFMVSTDIIYGGVDNKQLSIEKGKLYQPSKEIPLNEKVATCYSIKVGEEQEYIIVLVNNEIFDGRKLLLYNKEIPVYGKSIVISKNHNEIKYIRLKN
ncbi:MAG TPA: alginate lyase family protein [Tissierellales bacterium]|nr:alginate lyase family protein [Tissierellales bacterium]